MNNVLSLVCIAGCASGLLLIATLLTQKPRAASDPLLVCLLLLIISDVLFVAIKRLLPPQSIFELLRVSTYSGLVFAPLLYLYLRVQLTCTSFRKRMLWHFGWFTCFQTVVIFEVTYPASLPWLTVNSFEGLGVLTLLAGYFVANLNLLRAVRTHEQQSISFRRSNFVPATLLIVHVCYAGIAAVNLTLSQSMVATLTELSAGLLSLLLIVLSFSYLRQALSNTQASVTVTVQTPTPTYLDKEREKYGNNRLPEFVRDTIVTGLADHMQCEQPWLNIDLTLGRLADSINVNPHHLSQIINSEFGKSFACYINEYRVNAACKLLSADNNKTVLDVALHSGFSSKSSFNTIFKKHTGLTPSEYRRKYQHSSAMIFHADDILISGS